MVVAREKAPVFTLVEAEKLAETLFGVKAKASELPSYIDQNFQLTDASGQINVLKISNASEDEAFLDFQNKMMAHIADTAWDVAVSRVVPTRDGREIGSVVASDGTLHRVRLVAFVQGEQLGELSAVPAELVHDWGYFMGKLDRALTGFQHPAMQYESNWDVKRAAFIEDHLAVLEDEERVLLSFFINRFKQETEPRLTNLRSGVIHGDGNQNNLIVRRALMDRIEVCGIIDFGDAVYSAIVCEPAIAAAYAIMNQEEPVSVAATLIRGYHEAYPLTEAELHVLFDLICMRLCISVVMSAHRKQLEPNNPYLIISEKPAWSTLRLLRHIDPNLAHFTFRHACGLPAAPNSGRVLEWLAAHQSEPASVTGLDLKTQPMHVFNFGHGGSDLADAEKRADVAGYTTFLFDRIKTAGAALGVGRYNEVRGFYDSPLFAGKGSSGSREVHLGIDIFLPAGAPVYAPLKGRVHSFRNNDELLSYGPTIILEHEIPGTTFYTLYGHLSEASLKGLLVGMPVEKGAEIGAVGSYPVNGNWPPHLHFQVMLHMLGQTGDFYGVSTRSARGFWLNLCPDPNLILGIPEHKLAAGARAFEETLKARRKRIGPSLSLAYQQPLKIVRGRGAYLYDENDRAYLDMVNNVCHVGHCHPEVVAAAHRQMGILNTNTRYLNDLLATYAERLCAYMPDPLKVCFFVCSGSEANELALRMARAHSGGEGVVVVAGAYHGHTRSLIELSPYKCEARGGSGLGHYVRKVPMPDGYRGAYPYEDDQAGEKYAAHVETALSDLQSSGYKPAAFISESLLGCGGQIVPSNGYLKAAFKHARAAGAVCIADEVQVGFGRVGECFWGFQLQGVVPDIVTLGKPIGNGHPLAAVVTTPEIAASFNNGMEYFNTFGGNPVSCAVGMAVLDVIEDEHLQENAQRTGRHLLAGLTRLKDLHPIIGDVRGSGLFIGVELVLDRQTLEPAAETASRIIELMKREGILLSTDGPLHNVIKIKPPIIVNKGEMDRVVETLHRVLSSL